jgi:ABC-type multidrug transport system ATPase subunit
MHHTNEIVIQTQALSKSYKDVQALKSLDLSVKKNSIFGFLGPNGAGKTTTIKLLLGLIFPNSGSATVFGQDIVRHSVAIRARVGYLPQTPRFYERMTARQILRYTAGFYFKGPKDAIKGRVEETLKLVGLSDKADRPTVAILHHGELVAHGPIEELLGGGETAYAVTLKGNAGSAHARVSEEPWVSGIEVGRSGDATTWLVKVKDRKVAEARLLHLILLSEDLRVINFGPKNYEMTS